MKWTQATVRSSHFRPAQVLVVGFAALIVVGTVLLMLPIATADGSIPAFTTALFTATSAVCVTGLVVVSTASYWSLFGQLVILLLIQIGGLGIMTAATLIALLLGRRIGLRERLVIQQAMGGASLAGLVRLTKGVLVATFLIEGLGATLLTIRFAAQFPLGQALYYGVFHSISAFNNAGFHLFNTSLVPYVADPAVNLLIATLFIVGGLGFIVIADLYRWRTHRHWHLAVHSWLVLRVTGLLLVLGTVLVLLLECNNPGTLGPLPWPQKLLAAFFQSAAPRSCGFHTLMTNQLRPATLLLVMILMFIGASPGSTGGGIKTTTFAAVVMNLASIIRGKRSVVINLRQIPGEIVERAQVILAISLSLVLGAAFLLLTFGQGTFLAVLFESFSAVGTVGLSMGLTPQLTAAGRFVLIVAMFAGRLGPLTVATALARPSHEGVRYPQERISVG